MPARIGRPPILLDKVPDMIRLYVDEQKTLAQVAAELSVSAMAVKKNLNRVGLILRPPGFVPEGARKPRAKLPPKPRAKTKKRLEVPLVSAEKVRDLFDLDPETGYLTNKRTSRGRKAGKRVGYLRDDGYRKLAIDGILYLEHRIVWLHYYGELPSSFIDHRDMVKTNNRVENLRLATRNQNGANRPKPSNNSSGFKGVTWYRSTEKWLAQIRVCGKTINLGYYADKHNAAKAYEVAANRLFGEFARADTE